MIRSFSSGRKHLTSLPMRNDLARTAVEGFDAFDFHAVADRMRDARGVHPVSAAIDENAAVGQLPRTLRDALQQRQTRRRPRTATGRQQKRQTSSSGETCARASPAVAVGRHGADVARGAADDAARRMRLVRHEVLLEPRRRLRLGHRRPRSGDGQARPPPWAEGCHRESTPARRRPQRLPPMRPAPAAAAATGARRDTGRHHRGFRVPVPT
jgi:hypothetical protein